MIRTLEQMEHKVLALKNKHRVVVAWAQDSNTIGAINYALKKGLIEAILVGKKSEIKKTCKTEGIDESKFILVEADNEKNASSEAVRLVKNGDADIVMKGPVSYTHLRAHET